ncbi:hypothetical protein J6590_042831 [Homalodisca vitripennis]|nr:hypothetical protein J6590_042831 [Homalodisca vitripennis]
MCPERPVELSDTSTRPWNSLTQARAALPGVSSEHYPIGSNKCAIGLVLTAHPSACPYVCNSLIKPSLTLAPHRPPPQPNISEVLCLREPLHGAEFRKQSEEQELLKKVSKIVSFSTQRFASPSSTTASSEDTTSKRAPSRVSRDTPYCA